MCLKITSKKINYDHVAAFFRFKNWEVLNGVGECLQGDIIGLFCHEDSRTLNLSFERSIGSVKNFTIYQN